MTPILPRPTELGAGAGASEAEPARVEGARPRSEAQSAQASRVRILRIEARGTAARHLKALASNPPDAVECDHMRICPTCGRSHDDGVEVCPYDETPLTATQRETDFLNPDEVLGAYRVLGKIAVGGMGVIYRAEHVRLGRKVALKVLRQELLERTDILHRFFEEARAVNEIGHPNIIDIIDFVEDFQSNPPRVYMVMELLVGQDLAARIDSVGPLDPEEAVAVARQATDALIAVHRAKILHRDLKPENIFLCRREEGPPIVKLLDFGVAKTFGERQKVGITDPGTAVGTPEYMAPEQVLGRDLDDRTDVYALGLVLYDMLTDSVPFQSERYGEVLVMQVKDIPEPISTRRRRGKPVPPRLEQLVMRCLEKDPAQRYQSMRELRAALDDALVLDGADAPSLAPAPTPPAPEPVELQPLPPELAAGTEPDEPLPTARRRYVLLGLAASVIAGSLVAIFSLTGSSSRGTSPLTKASRPDARAAIPPSPRPDAAAVAAVAADRGPAPDLAAPKVKRPGGKKKGGKKTKPGLEGTVDPFNP